MTIPVFHNFSSAPTHVAPFSHAVEFDGWVQLTGQMPTDPIDDTKPLPEGIQAQTRRVMDNLAIILNETQLGLENVLSTRVFLTNFRRDYDAMNNIYKSYFAKDRLPARTCVGVTDLALGALVEIDMVAKRF
jgi:reactive intermediate/imine deaminase